MGILGVIEFAGAMIGSLAVAVGTGMLVMETTMRALESVAAHIHEKRESTTVSYSPEFRLQRPQEGQQVVSL